MVQTNLQVDATYEFTLYAMDDCGDVRPSSIRLVRLNDTEAPSAPIVAAPAFDPANHFVALAWIPSSDNIQVDHYEILRNGVPIGATDTTAYTDNLPTQHADLSYVVRAVDTNGNESDSAPALISTPDWTSPTAPVLSVTADGTAVTLRWVAATDNVGVVGYDVLRDGKQIAERDRRSTHVQGHRRSTGRAHVAGARARQRGPLGHIGGADPQDHEAGRQGDAGLGPLHEVGTRRRPATRSAARRACSSTCASSARCRRSSCACTSRAAAGASRSGAAHRARRRRACSSAPPSCATAT